MTKLKNISINVSILIISITISIILIEFLLRIFVFDPTKYYIRTPGWSNFVTDDNLLTNVTSNYMHKINRFGFRGEPPNFNSKPMILTIGGSTTENWVLDNKSTWSAVLEKKLIKTFKNVDVINLGKAGTNGRHNLIQLDKTSDYLPKIDVYIVLIGLNDFLFDHKIHHSTSYKDEWWYEQSFMSQPYQEGKFALSIILKRIIKKNQNNPPVSHFGLYLEELRNAFQNVKKNQIVEKLENLENLDKYLNIYENTIMNLKKFADSKNSSIIFLTQPFLWSKNMSEETKKNLYCGYIGTDHNSPDTKWYSIDTLRKGLDSYNKKLLSVCEKYQLFCVDLEKEIPKSINFFYDDIHFTNKGAELIALKVNEKIIKNKWFENFQN